MGFMEGKKDLPVNGKKTKGRVRIKMEFIHNKLRRYTTFSKRKTGIMKKVSIEMVRDCCRAHPTRLVRVVRESASVRASARYSYLCLRLRLCLDSCDDEVHVTPVVV